jgi:hypothetical protein
MFDRYLLNELIDRLQVQCGNVLNQYPAPVPLTLAPPLRPVGPIGLGSGGPMRAGLVLGARAPTLGLAYPASPRNFDVHGCPPLWWGCPCGQGDLSTKGTWTEEEPRLSKVLEMEVYYPGVLPSQHFDSCRLFSETGGTHSDTLCRLTWDLFQLCTRLGFELIPRHIPGNRHILAYVLSRAEDSMDFSSGCGSAPCEDVGRSHGWFVCHQAEQTTPPILLSPAGRRSLAQEKVSFNIWCNPTSGVAILNLVSCHIFTNWLNPFGNNDGEAYEAYLTGGSC